MTTRYDINTSPEDFNNASAIYRVMEQTAQAVVYDKITPSEDCHMVYFNAIVDEVVHTLKNCRNMEGLRVEEDPDGVWTAAREKIAAEEAARAAASAAALAADRAAQEYAADWRERTRAAVEAHKWTRTDVTFVCADGTVATVQGTRYQDVFVHKTESGMWAVSNAAGVRCATYATRGEARCAAVSYARLGVGKMLATDTLPTLLADGLRAIGRCGYTSPTREVVEAAELFARTKESLV